MNDQNLPLLELLAMQKEIEKLSSKEAQNLAWKDLREKGLLAAERLRIGREKDKSSVIRLKDGSGRVRIELKVAADGNSSLTFLDDSGKAVYRIPPPGGSGSKK